MPFGYLSLHGIVNLAPIMRGAAKLRGVVRVCCSVSDAQPDVETCQDCYCNHKQHCGSEHHVVPSS
jgi:hypothetical protein